MIKVNPKYYPLYITKKNIILITGSRESGKSFEVSAFLERLMQKKGHGVLFTRYTMTSAHISIIPEFVKKIELDGVEDEFKILKTGIEHDNGSFILFRGIKTSSGNQTASLKSIEGISTFVIDEGEEWQNPEEFDKIRYSIRAENVQHRTIFIMNPSDKDHFIYKRYIKDTNKIVKIDGVDVEISTHPDVEHIHTTYLDNLAYVPEYRKKEIEALRNSKNKDDRERYEHIWLGRWGLNLQGKLHQDIQTFAHNFEGYNPNECYNFSFTDVADRGNDYLSTIFVKLHNNEAYVFDAIYTKESSAITLPLLDEYFKRHNTIENVIETNNQGSVFITYLNEKGHNTFGVTNTANKITRMKASAFYVKNLLFKESGSEEYNNYLMHLRRFPANCISKNDDAPDVTALCVSYLTENYPHTIKR